VSVAGEGAEGRSDLVSIWIGVEAKDPESGENEEVKGTELRRRCRLPSARIGWQGIATDCRFPIASEGIGGIGKTRCT